MSAASLSYVAGLYAALTLTLLAWSLNRWIKLSLHMAFAALAMAAADETAQTMVEPRPVHLRSGPVREWLMAFM